MSATSPRIPDHEVEPFFPARWSPRALTGEAVPREALLSMFEAARWSPSSYNSQPWRLPYSVRGDEHWDRFVGLLNEFNRSWADKAGALVCFVSKSTLLPPGRTEEIPSVSHSFDCGAAWGYFALQAHLLGYVAHGMVGFDRDAAFEALHVPAGHRVEMMAAVGRQGDAATLPESMRSREAPNGRNPVDSFALPGGFPRT